MLALDKPTVAKQHFEELHYFYLMFSVLVLRSEELHEAFRCFIKIITDQVFSITESHLLDNRVIQAKRGWAVSYLE